MNMSNKDEVCIVSYARTPIGSFLGSLSSFSATKLGALAIEEAVKRSKIDPHTIDEVLMGCVLTSGLGQAPARQASIFAGLPDNIPCTTVGKVCGSGLKAVMFARQAILSGEADVIVAGGMESMSNAPHLLQMRSGQKMGDGKLEDSMLKDGLWDVYNDYHMGQAGELCAAEKDVSREAQDAYAKMSYQRAQAAFEKGCFKNEILPIDIQIKKESRVLDCDEDIFKAKFEKFPTLRPVFSKDGSITAANASNLNDGAAALVLASKAWCDKNNIAYKAVISGSSQAARKPEWFTMAPADAIASLHAKLNWQAKDVDAYEINEAFSVVSLAVSKELNLNLDKVNCFGGAVAMGHPIGASGARILITLMSVLQQANKHKGIASLCIGGGEAVALGIEMEAKSPLKKYNGDKV